MMNKRESNEQEQVYRLVECPPTIEQLLRPALIALVKDLYDSSGHNRDFLRPRFQAENSAGDALEKYRRKIVEQFLPSRGFGKLKRGEARKAMNLVSAK